MKQPPSESEQGVQIVTDGPGDGKAEGAESCDDANLIPFDDYGSACRNIIIL